MKGYNVIYLKPKQGPAMGLWAFNGPRPGWIKVILRKPVAIELLNSCGIETRRKPSRSCLDGKPSSPADAQPETGVAEPGKKE